MSRISQMLRVIEDGMRDPLCPAYGRAMVMLMVFVILLPWMLASWAREKARAMRGRDRL